MQAPAREFDGRLAYQVHDRMPIPGEIPELGVAKGDEGIVRDLVFHNGAVTAFVEVSYSTGRTRGWAFVRVVPGTGIASHIAEA